MILKRLRAYLQRKSAEAVLHMSNPVEVEALLLNSKFLMAATTLVSNLVQVLYIRRRCALACSFPAGPLVMLGLRPHTASSNHQPPTD